MRIISLNVLCCFRNNLNFPLQAFYECADLLDVNSIYSNDLNLMLDKYGVEACNRSIVKVGTN